MTDQLLKDPKDTGISYFDIGHEDHTVNFRKYNEIRQGYLEQDPETWKKWMEEVRSTYGHGKYSLPESKETASPFERIAFHSWLLDRYNKHLAEVSNALREINPDVKIVSDIEVNGMFPMGYERAVGTYDTITQQMLYGCGSFRQEVAFATKLAGDLAETPVSEWGSRGGTG